jgi:hypothetical protein
MSVTVYPDCPCCLGSSASSGGSSNPSSGVSSGDSSDDSEGSSDGSSGGSGSNLNPCPDCVSASSLWASYPGGTLELPFFGGGGPSVWQADGAITCDGEVQTISISVQCDSGLWTASVTVSGIPPCGAGGGFNAEADVTVNSCGPVDIDLQFLGDCCPGLTSISITE